MVGLSSAFFRNQEEIEKLIQDTDIGLSLIESIYLDCETSEAKDEDIINKEFTASNRTVYEILKRKYLMQGLKSLIIFLFKVH